MSYSYTDTYTNIRNYNKLDKILNEIVQKMEGSPDSFSKKENDGFKRNIKKLKDWIVENNAMGVECLPSDDYADKDFDSDKGSGSDMPFIDESAIKKGCNPIRKVGATGLTCVTFHSVGFLKGQIQLGHEFRDKHGIKFIPYADFYVTSTIFSVQVKGIIYSVYSNDKDIEYGLDDV